MDLQENIILIDGINKTYQVESIEFDGLKYAIKFANAQKSYTYSVERVIWLNQPTPLEVGNAHVFIHGSKESKLKSVGIFMHRSKKYYAVTFQSGYVRHCTDDEFEIRKTCLVGQSADIFEYFRQCAQANTLGYNEDEEGSHGILSSIYSKIDFVDEKSATAPYLNPRRGVETIPTPKFIFPFGCNASQERAVKSALTNQLSVIQGPPGTGKTQTILNIIANLLISDKSVLVVSNNNSATENVLEKLAKNGFGFLVAPLGNRKNKEAFIANQPKLNPEINTWRKTTKELEAPNEAVKTSLEKIGKIFALQERLAMLKQELAEAKVERRHFSAEQSIGHDSEGTSISSFKILKLLNKIKIYADRNKDDIKGLLAHIKSALQKLDLELRLRFMLKIKANLSAEVIPMILSHVELLFYANRIAELEKEIAALDSQLEQMDSTTLMKSLTFNSLTILKAFLARKYKDERNLITSPKDLYNCGNEVLKDFPVVLSTTFSSKTIFNSETMFDYVIMDEASQVSIETGILALTCAKNAVIVGDTMQLPNVVTDEDMAKLNNIRNKFNIPDAYDATRHSFLSSLLAAIPRVPQTLLREHYRCHPDIINFCNQKFYGGNLLIMTERGGKPSASQPLMAFVTSQGQHARGHYNQREIDTVKLEVLPRIKNQESIGIITPYNRQVEQFITQLPEIECATVHKYQGREKDTIIMSVTDDEITEFADNANLLNVAVSRAKESFCLVVTGNPQELKGNINDLLGYIRYQHGRIEQSKLHSIYDYLFTNVNAFDKSSEKISEYDSENLTYSLIDQISKSHIEWSHIKALCHYPLRSLISGIDGLTEREVRYAMHPSTHIDFLIINRVTKVPLLAIETDGYSYHHETTEQSKRDLLKDHILGLLGLPLLRLSTIGHSEEQKILEALKKSSQPQSLPLSQN